MSAFISKYGVAVHVYIPMVKRAVVDFAVGADWTPAAGDVKVSKDGGAAANVTNLPTAITMGNTAMWDYSMTATEMQAAKVMVTIADSATKAVEDSMFIIWTHGNASGQYQVDFADATAFGLSRLDAAVTSRLAPTVAARTLDVSAGGEAGVDWANVGSPTTANALTATTIATTQKVDVETIKTNAVVNAGTVTFPTTATLASTTNITAGTVTTATNVTTVNGLAANVITATSIAADAITDAKVAADVTIASVTGAVGSVTGAVGSVTGAVGSVTAAVATTSNVKKNQALANFRFLMTDSTNHNPATGKTVTVTRGIDSGAQAAGSLSAVTEIANGEYRVDFAASDLNGNVIVLRATASGCDDTFERVVTQP